MSADTANEKEARVFIAEILGEVQMADRGVRKAIAAKRFPKPDGRLFRRNFWLRSTYEQWKAEVSKQAHHRLLVARDAIARLILMGHAETSGRCLVPAQPHSVPLGRRVT
jgi:hypothetical protein